MMLYEHPNTKSASEVNKEIEDVEEIVDEYGDIANNLPSNVNYTLQLGQIASIRPNN